MSEGAFETSHWSTCQLVVFHIVPQDLFLTLTSCLMKKFWLAKAGQPKNRCVPWHTVLLLTLSTMSALTFLCLISPLQSTCSRRMYMTTRFLSAYRPCHARWLGLLLILKPIYVWCCLRLSHSHHEYPFAMKNKYSEKLHKKWIINKDFLYYF